MRRLRWIALAAALALAATGISVAAHKRSAPDTDSVAASFTADRTWMRVRTCTGTDGATYREAVENWEGAVEDSADSRLDGMIRLRTHSLVNTSTGWGTTTGHVWIRGDSGGLKAKARLIGVNRMGGILTGVLNGRAPGEGRLVANFRATFTGDEVSGELGSGAADNLAVIQHGRCRGREAPGATAVTGMAAKLEVRKRLKPGRDPGRFNLQIDGVTQASDVGDHGTTGKRSVTAGNHTVGETAGAGTSLADYDSEIRCRSEKGRGGTAAEVSGAGPLTVNVPAGGDIVCTVTNERKSG